jgi:hypothetical protein
LTLVFIEAHRLLQVLHWNNAWVTFLSLMGCGYLLFGEGKATYATVQVNPLTDHITNSIEIGQPSMIMECDPPPAAEWSWFQLCSTATFVMREQPQLGNVFEPIMIVGHYSGGIFF